MPPLTIPPAHPGHGNRPELLEPWKVGDRITARRLNQPVEALNRARSRLDPPREIPFQTTPAGNPPRFAVLRAIPEPGERILLVQILDKGPAVEGKWTGDWVVDPESSIVEAYTWGNLTALEYVQHVWTSDAIEPHTPVLTLLFDGSHWTALHSFKFLVGSHQPQTNTLRMTDCQP